LSSAPDLRITLRASRIERRFGYCVHWLAMPLPWLA